MKSENLGRFSFAVSLEFLPPLHRKTVAVELILSEGESLEEFSDMVACLCDLSGFGAFAENEDQVKDSRAQLNDSKAPNPRTWTATITFSHVHFDFFRIFLQTLAQCHHFVEPVVSLKVSDLALPHGHRFSLSVEEIVNASYVKRFDRLPFAVVQAEGITNEINAVRLKTRRPVSVKEYEVARKVFEDWASLVYTGGFASPFRSLDTFQLLKVKVTKIHNSLIECAVFGWNADQAAIDFLINVCYGLNAKVFPIEELEIE